ncbi:MAG TPA: metallophosphoesterase, partial [Flavisolibacter sp.]|nr:metallophosphoesterase [Flavisolibacter sp.]
MLLSFAFRYPANTQASRPVLLHSGDSALTCASNRYEAHSFLRILFMGENYRKQWQQPVTLPVFRLSETSFRITELGGGQQTKSLKLTDNAGKAWALRTIDKDVSGAIPVWLQSSFAQKLKQDQISASMPYSSLLIGELADALGINAAKPTIYLVADDTALGTYRQIFAHSVCMLEERDPHFATTVTTADVLRQVQHDNRFLIDQRLWLKARLFDMLINDWDRHYDNWRWGLVDSAGLHFYKAIPRDRDWAFYCSDGLLPKLLRLTTDRFLINFSPQVKYVKSLNAKAYYMDAAFLNGLDARDWEKSVVELQSALTDEAIERAVKKLPPAIFASLG